MIPRPGGWVIPENSMRPREVTIMMRSIVDKVAIIGVAIVFSI
jgi:hypothetical protein